MDWFVKSIVAMFLMAPFFILTNAFGRLGYRPETMMFYWLLAVAIGIAAWMAYNGEARALLPDKCMSTIFILGLVCGAVANILLIQAIVESFNPGLPVAIVGANSLVVFLVTPILAIIIPQYFQHVGFNWTAFIGIVMTVTGIGLICVSR
ncbi:MAG: hypothetical protein U5L10_02235 [Candidatus Moranbacteria bacterium]|nr:hypothetical protein [Candidatus Moranbacteria bacterium]